MQFFVRFSGNEARSCLTKPLGSQIGSSLPKNVNVVISTSTVEHSLNFAVGKLVFTLDATQYNFYKIKLYNLSRADEHSSNY